MFDLVESGSHQREAFRADVLAGLSGRQKAIPSRWLYDRRGSELFEEITGLDEYYPTRTETAILRRYAEEMGALCGRETVLLEYGAGAGLKFEILLGALKAPRMYVPIDIAGDFLDQTVARIRDQFPRLLMRPIIADFTTDFDVPADVPEVHRAAFFPGSTIGNLDRTEASAFLRRMRRHTGLHGKAIIGVDLRKDTSTLIAAYDDLRGVTAAFNLNLLARINHELGADFRVDRFAHEARWNEYESAIEMHLVSLDTQAVAIAGRHFAFERGETIHTESSRKYDVPGFTDLVLRSGWRVARVWSDPAMRFAVFGVDSAG
ncbi:MAG: egtD [Bradyrhizobium sp.]|nr:egtD [Bradyrhizobium sp.]